MGLLKAEKHRRRSGASQQHHITFIFAEGHPSDNSSTTTETPVLNSPHVCFARCSSPSAMQVYRVRAVPCCCCARRPFHAARLRIFRANQRRTAGVSKKSDKARRSRVLTAVVSSKLHLSARRESEETQSTASGEREYGGLLRAVEVAGGQREPLTRFVCNQDGKNTPFLVSLLCTYCV